MVTPRSNGAAEPHAKSIPTASNSGLTKNSSKQRKSNVKLTNEPSSTIAKHQEQIDILRWRCLDEKGRLTWRYLEDDAEAEDWPQSYADKWYLGLDLVRMYCCSRITRSKTI